MQHLTLNSITRAIVLIASHAYILGLTGQFVPQSWAQTAATSPVSSNTEFKRGEPVTLNFANAEIDAVARAMATLTGRQVVVDPRVKGTMNLSTERAVSPAAAYNLFLATLRLQGFTVVEAAGLDKVVPEADAKLQSGTVSAGAASSSSNQIVTQIFKLNFENANNLVPVLRPLISPNNTINVNPGNNSLVITDYADNLQRMARIIAAMDVSNATDVEVIKLQHAIAADLAPLVLRLIESGSSAAAAPGQGQTDSAFKTTLVAEPRSNSLILRAANAARVTQVKSLIEKLDTASTQSNGASGNIYVVYLKNADATKLAATLRAAMSGDARSTIASVVAPNTPVPIGGATPGLNQTTTGGQIQADTATNSLIITAPEPQYRQLRSVIDKLDARRAQVFVESLIAEVNADQAAQFGIQWQTALGNAGNGTVGVLGTNFGKDGKNIISLATQGASGALTPPTGLNLGAANLTNGIYVLGFLANFLESTGAGNILSTPNLLTLDNEEAKIVIGQNVPFVTGQYSNTAASAGGVVNPFQTIERKDVGLTLKVKPQISENGTVKLAIFQEVSSVQASSINSATGLITNKRSIESNVLVDDGSIVVLGGLLQDEYSGNQDKVPGLGDIPFFGNLFKSESRSRKKTNLMVFLRPVVVRSAADSDALSQGRYDLMRGNQINAQPVPSSNMPINESAVLPAPKPR
jgi:general secretion pathway protein D